MAILIYFPSYILIKKQDIDGNMALIQTTVAIVTAVNEEEKKRRKKKRRRAFIELVKIAKLKTRYHRRRIHFFAYDGFFPYTFECENSDFKQIMLEVIEFSNNQ